MSSNPLEQEVYVSLEFTPNPNTLKYSVNRELVKQGAANFLTVEEAQARSPLAFKLMQVPGVAAVMLGKNFVTVTKTEAGDWDVVHRSCSDGITTHLQTNQPIFHEGMETLERPGSSGGGTEIENKIKSILDAEIRPAVAMDGGDITFERFEAGVVYLHMQGACSGCPSSTATLKMGIETRLKEQIPEILEVVAV